MTVARESRYGRRAWPVAALSVSLLQLCAFSTAAEESASRAQSAPASQVSRKDAQAQTARARLQSIVNGSHRSAENRVRDKFRHPVETLMFFGIRPDMTVVELWPFGGWYTEILAPYLKGSGTLYAAAMDPKSTNEVDLKYNAELRAMLESRPELFSEVKVSVLAPGKYEIAPNGSADLVLTFRNIHNWVWSGIEKEVFAAAYRALKPGGILGVVEHRHDDPSFEPRQPGQAYVGEAYAIALIESVGFQLAGKSDINRNPKDTKDYARGVWTLPPSYALGDTDREKYAAIGESDRFTLRFMKPVK